MMNMRYDRQANQAAACARCVTPVFLRRKNSRKHLYAIPVCIKQTNLKLERFRRVATRCDSIHISYSAIISLAHGLAMAKPLRTA